LVIAHKISTIKNSNKIVVLDAGNVVDQGTHEELLSKCKVYQSLYQMENK
jgi:ABC-type multidrug transport system fused ATPase/permease subunit